MNTKKKLFLGLSVGLATIPFINQAPIEANAWGSSDVQIKNNIKYEFEPGTSIIKKRTFVPGASLYKDPMNVGRGTYNAYSRFGGGTNLSLQSYYSLYGNGFVGLVPDGYSPASFIEHTQSQNMKTSCILNTGTNVSNYGNFKKYSTIENYVGCKDYNYGGMNEGGNWRYIGFSSDGVSPMPNPSFPADFPLEVSVNNYKWDSNYGAETSSQYDKPSFNDVKTKVLKEAMNKYNFGNHNSSASIETWKKKLSLISDPELETPIFKGLHSSNLYYRSVIGVTDPKLLRDLSITKMEVFDSSGKMIGIFNRDSSGKTNSKVYGHVTSGGTYTFKVTAKSEGGMESSHTKIQNGLASGYKATTKDELSYFKNDTQKGSATGNKLKHNESTTITYTKAFNNLKHGDDARGTAMIDKSHADKTESTDITNDWAKVLFKVDNGNFSATDVTLLDENGRPVSETAPIPGKKYKFRFHYKYEGPKKDGLIKTKITNSVKRTLNNGDTDTYEEVIHEEFHGIKNGDTFYYTTKEAILCETPKAVATSKMSISTEHDTSSKDNSVSETFDATYDINVHNVRIYNKYERPVVPGQKITVGIKYDVDVITPSYVPHFELDTQTKINNNLIFNDHLHKGENNDITREIDVIVSGTGKIPAQVTVNKPTNRDERFYEKNYDNNTASTSQTKHPSGGDGSLEILPPENPKNGGCTLSGATDAKSFSKKHQILNYNGTYINHNIYGGDNKPNSQRGLYVYSPSKASTMDKSYNESYKVVDVLFKSKMTEDLGQGDKGWVSIMRNPGAIKAGYGYELKVITEYETNAIKNQPKPSANPTKPLSYHGSAKSAPSKSTGKTVNDLNTMANVPNDIYVKTSDNKLLSATGIHGTIKAFTPRVITSNDEVVRVEYSLGTKVNGVITNDKIYVDENTKDGKYNLSVFTPNVSGISQKNLCDKVNVKFEVKGSMLDDSNDHVVQ